ncbi:MAG TPA: lipid-A-disaccharide synthase [Crocinitomix sp.]|nr:lipid-A-disaccharide synthase [Crocinitomix sp.]
MKYYIIAGEASGDLHGSNLMKAIIEKDNEAEFRFWGGDQMQNVTNGLVKHIKHLAFMGFIEVVMNIRTIAKNIKFCKQDLLNYQPDALILIDYPGFNLRIAEFAHQNNIRIHYYISPQIWAWKQNRVHKIKRVVNEMYCILPFEKEFYKKFNVDVHYVGHPLVDAINNFKRIALSKNEFLQKNNLRDKPILAILPGSRNQEIKVKLPLMIKASASFPNHQIVIAGAPNKTETFYKPFINNTNVIVLENQTYDLLNHSDLAIVTSGTATLETALFKVPQVVCYKASAISYHIAKRLVKIDYISLVNLIMDKEVVTELIQGDLIVKNIVEELKKIENHQSNGRLEMINQYHQLIQKLGGGGASQKVANLLIKDITNNA